MSEQEARRGNGDSIPVASTSSGSLQTVASPSVQAVIDQCPNSHLSPKKVPKCEQKVPPHRAWHHSPHNLHAGHASHKFIARIQEIPEDIFAPPSPPKGGRKLYQPGVDDASDFESLRLPPISQLWQPSWRDADFLKRERLERERFPRLKEGEKGRGATTEQPILDHLSTNISDYHQLSGAVVSTEDSTGVAVQLRACSDEKKQKISKGRKAAPQRNGGWDPRTSKNGLFGSYGPQPVCTPNNPHFDYPVTRGRQQDGPQFSWSAEGSWGAVETVPE
ncbi:hypothetical protein CYMTET_12879 [Cymbomonas tetramitiformis]|uniref:Uncharacterized protein n=1 Tax=Cymbomonas tetramitiformis TaxID=36881 RepID=A0AAE0LBE5_9CHLO|nr:hypothetical protein CYMTET_12879 [Cymbomonas tetramitiformis]